LLYPPEEEETPPPAPPEYVGPATYGYGNGQPAPIPYDPGPARGGYGYDEPAPVTYAERPPEQHPAGILAENSTLPPGYGARVGPSGYEVVPYSPPPAPVALPYGSQISQHDYAQQPVSLPAGGQIFQHDYGQPPAAPPYQEPDTYDQPLYDIGYHAYDPVEDIRSQRRPPPAAPISLPLGSQISQYDYSQPEVVDRHATLPVTDTGWATFPISEDFQPVTVRTEADRWRAAPLPSVMGDPAAQVWPGRIFEQNIRPGWEFQRAQERNNSPETQAAIDAIGGPLDPGNIGRSLASLPGAAWNAQIPTSSLNPDSTLPATMSMGEATGKAQSAVRDVAESDVMTTDVRDAIGNAWNADIPFSKIDPTAPDISLGDAWSTYLAGLGEQTDIYGQKAANATEEAARLGIQAGLGTEAGRNVYGAMTGASDLIGNIPASLVAKGAIQGAAQIPLVGVSPEAAETLGGAAESALKGRSLGDVLGDVTSPILDPVKEFITKPGTTSEKAGELLNLLTYFQYGNVENTNHRQRNIENGLDPNEGISGLGTTFGGAQDVATSGRTFLRDVVRDSFIAAARKAYSDAGIDYDTLPDAEKAQVEAYADEFLRTGEVPAAGVDLPPNVSNTLAALATFTIPFLSTDFNTWVQDPANKDIRRQIYEKASSAPPIRLPVLSPA